MSNENENENKKEQIKENPAPTPTVEDFIKVAEKRVSQDEFNALQKRLEQSEADKAKLMESILDGKNLPRSKAKKQTLEEAQKNFNEVLKKRDVTNLEFTEASVAYRDAVLESGGPEPYAAPNASEADLLAAQHVAEVRKQVLAEADGDPDKFNYLWEKRVANEDPALATAIKKRALKK